MHCIWSGGCLPRLPGGYLQMVRDFLSWPLVSHPCRGQPINKGTMVQAGEKLGQFLSTQVGSRTGSYLGPGSSLSVQG